MKIKNFIIVILVLCTFSILKGQDTTAIYWSGGKARKFHIGGSFYGENILFLKNDSSFIMKRIGFPNKSEYKRRDDKMIEENTSIVEGNYSIDETRLKLFINGDAKAHWTLRIIRNKLISHYYKSLIKARLQKDMTWKRTNKSNFKVK